MNTSVSDVKYDYIILENFKPLRMAALFNLIPKQLKQCFCKTPWIKARSHSYKHIFFYFFLFRFNILFLLYIKLTVVVCKNGVFVQKHMDLTVYIVQS